jgi:ribosomal 50S subunit-associated protein YjgA (DUF615 family)
MPCTARETALLLIAERGPSGSKEMRQVLLDRFPTLTFLAATDLLDEAAKVRQAALDAGCRVNRGEVEGEAALAGLVNDWPKASEETLRRLLEDGIAAALK